MKKRIFILSILTLLTGVTSTAAVLPERFCPDCLNLAAVDRLQEQVSPQVSDLGINVASILRPHLQPQLQPDTTGVAALPSWVPAIEGFTPNWPGPGLASSMANLFSTLNPAFVMPACQSLWSGSLWPNDLLPCSETSFTDNLPPSLLSI